MLILRPAAERGYADHGWLQARHSFSFAEYYDPRHMGVSVLRVINEDRVAPGAGFPTHGHADMEIITYILSGILEHRDSMGNTAQILAGEVQLMSAGSGVTHSEYNPSATEPVHLLQIWVRPRTKGVTPGYQQRDYAGDDATLRLLVSGDGAEDSLLAQQDFRLYRVQLQAGEHLTQTLDSARTYYVQVAKGAGMLNDRALAAGDGLSLTGETELLLQSEAGLEALLFELP
ncbi:MAG: pirin family protein [Gammaproteobacteria bacterium]|nr:pirin family protein [Gammaproteobacteria bacterium]